MGRRIGYDGWSGLVMLIIAIAVASPWLIGVAEPAVPIGWWIALFAVFLTALFLAVALSHRRWRIVAFGVAVVASWALVLTTQALGLLNVLLVITAAVSVYIFPLAVGFLLVGVNTTVLAGIVYLQDVPRVESIFFLGFYLLIQAATLLSTAALFREQRLRQELAQAHLDLRAASALLDVSARSAERLRISRDLHDAIGHQLTALSLELEAAKHRGPERSREHIDRAAGLTRGLLCDVRSTVDQLRGETADLADALEHVVADLPGIHVELDVEPELRLDGQHTEALVRAVQEIITNAVRHAEAQRLWIEVALEGAEVILTAVDDGRATQEPTAASQRSGHGLRGIAERFGALGGSADFRAGDGRHGFRVTARVPAS